MPKKHVRTLFMVLALVLNSSLVFSKADLALALDGTGTTNFVSKWRDADTLADSLIFDDGRNIGIGDTTPAALFTVGSGDLFRVTSTGQTQGISGSATAPSFSFTADTNTGMYRPSADTLRFVTNGSPRFSIQSSGNIGIGDTSPTALFTVGNGDLVQVVSTGEVRGISGTQTSPSFSFTSDTNTGLYRGGSDILKLVTAGLDRLTVSSNGFVGIGTTSPSANLHISSQTDAGSSSLLIENTGRDGSADLQFNTPSFQYNISLNETDGTLDFGLPTRGGLSSHIQPVVSLGASVDEATCVTQWNPGCVEFIIGTAFAEYPISGFDNLGIYDEGGAGFFIRDPLNDIEAEMGVLSGAGIDGLAFGTTTAHPVKFETDGTTKMTITKTGLVGIGTSEPDQNFTIEDDVGKSYSSLNVKDGTREIFLGVNSTGGILSVMSDHDLGIRTGGNNEQMRIMANGNVGIGTKNPDRNLTIEDDDGKSYLNVKSVDAVGMEDREILLGVERDSIDGSATGGILSVMSDHDLGIRTGGNNEQMRIMANGNVGIGTDSPGSKLTVNGIIEALEGLPLYEGFKFPDGEIVASKDDLKGIQGEKGDKGATGDPGYKGVTGDPGQPGSSYAINPVSACTEDHNGYTCGQICNGSVVEEVYSPCEVTPNTVYYCNANAADGAGICCVCAP